MPRETPSSRARSREEGNRSPARSRPPRTAARSWSCSWCPSGVVPERSRTIRRPGPPPDQPTVIGPPRSGPVQRGPNGPSDWNTSSPGSTHVHRNPAGRDGRNRLRRSRLRRRPRLAPRLALDRRLRRPTRRRRRYAGRRPVHARFRPARRLRLGAAGRPRQCGGHGVPVPRPGPRADGSRRPGVRRGRGLGACPGRSVAGRTPDHARLARRLGGAARRSIWSPATPPRKASRSGGRHRDGGLAGLGFGVFFVALAQIPESAGLLPLAANQGVGAMLTLVLAGALRQPLWPRERSSRRAAVWGAAGGLLGTSGTVAFLFASHTTHLAVTGVLASLYPAVTVLLAAVLLREPSGPAKPGPAVCGASVCLVALG